MHIPELVEDPTTLIGRTPLVALRRLTEGYSSRVLVKLENRNLGGSSKDRVALNMIRTAEREGLLAPGGTIVESTSGNTGIGLALVGSLTGHPVVIVYSPSYISAEKAAILRSYGAELVEANWDATPDDPSNPRAVAERIAQERPGSWYSSQYHNGANPLAHYEGTGPEIWQQTGGAVTHFVAGIGTGGTVSGTGRYLKEISRGAVRVIGADPHGSGYSGNTPGTINVEGVGSTWPQENWPNNFDSAIVDEFHQPSDQRVYETLHALSRQEGLLLGPSSGLSISVALEIARNAPAGSTVVVVAPDNGTNYLTKAYNPEWLAASGIEIAHV